MSSLSTLSSSFSRITGPTGSICFGTHSLTSANRLQQNSLPQRKANKKKIKDFQSLFTDLRGNISVLMHSKSRWDFSLTKSSLISSTRITLSKSD